MNELWVMQKAEVDEERDRERSWQILCVVAMAFSYDFCKYIIYIVNPFFLCLFILFFIHTFFI